KKVLEKIQSDGYVRMRIDGEMVDVGEEIELEKIKKHDIDVDIDCLVIKDGIRSRLVDSLETALELAEGYATIDIIDGEEIVFSEHHACPVCGFTIPALEPRLFSFNAPFGACGECDGLGTKLIVDIDLVIPDDSLSLEDGVILPWQPISSQYYPEMLRQACEQFEIDMNVPFNELSKKDRDLILYGS